MSDHRTAEFLGNRNLKSAGRPHSVRRIAAIAGVVAAHLAGTGFGIDVATAATGLSSAATVSVNGTTGHWAPAGDSAAAPATTADPTTASPAPTSAQEPVPAEPTAPDTGSTTSSVGDTPPAPGTTTLDEPAPTTSDDPVPTISDDPAPTTLDAPPTQS